jgi:hypothetical protein
MEVSIVNVKSFATLLCLTLAIGSSAQAEKGALAGADAYLGQKPPADAAVRLAPPAAGSVVIERVCFSLDGKEFYYTDYGMGGPVIKHVAFVDGRWAAPETLFEGYIGPSLSPDESRLYFEDSAKRGWVSMRKGGAWSPPSRLTQRAFLQHDPTETASGRLYVSSDPKIGSRADVSVLDAAMASASNLPAPLNSRGNGFDYFVSRDESFVIVVRLDVGFGAGDLYVSFRRGDGSWTDPLSLGPAVDSASWEYAPYVTPDGKYVFFTRDEERATYWAPIEAVLRELRKKAGLGG